MIELVGGQRYCWRRMVGWTMRLVAWLVGPCGWWHGWFDHAVGGMVGLTMRLVTWLV